jgi:proline dehydrogenase
MSARFVAGPSLEDALSVCARLKNEGIGTTLDYLGENVRSLDEASQCRNVYLGMLDALGGAGLEPNVSLKLTQFGLDFSGEACEENVAAVVERAAGLGGFVRIDMESSAYTERTLGIATRLHRRFESCGVVVQAYLRRSKGDVANLIGDGVRVRLCKGAYLEPPQASFQKKSEVDGSYYALSQTLLEANPDPAIATHDEAMIGRVERYAANRGIAKGRFEFEMLYGIRRDLQKRLVADGYRMRVYVPFGEAWYPYFMRRLAERPANLFFLLRNLVR